MNEKNLSRRDFLRLSAVTASGAVLAACAPQVVEKTVEVPVKETVIVEKEVEKEVEVEVPVEKVVTQVVPLEQVTLRYSGWVFGNWQELFDNLTERFTEVNPGIKVIAELGDWTANQQKVTAEVAAGMPPDVGMGPWMLLLCEDKLLDMKPFMERDAPEFDWDNYFDFCKAHAHINPENGVFEPGAGMYNTPMAAYGAMVYYNKNLFDEAVLPYPEDDWTWDDLLTNALQLTKDAEGNTANEPGFDPTNVLQWGVNGLTHWKLFQMYAWALGGEVLTPDYSSCAMTDQAWIDTFNFVSDLVNTHNVHPGGMAGGIVPEGGFMSGQLAIEFNMNWVLAPYINGIEEFDWGLAAIPSLNGVRKPYAVPDVNSIFVDGKHHEESWTFVKYFTSEECNRDFISKELPPPFVKVAFSDDYLGVVEPYNAEALKIAWSEGRLLQGDKTVEHWAPMLDQFMQGMVLGETGSVEETLEGLCQEIDKLRAEHM
jgi:multiple sugar transport system substrate-binding protein